MFTIDHYCWYPKGYNHPEDFSCKFLFDMYFACLLQFYNHLYNRLVWYSIVIFTWMLNILPSDSPFIHNVLSDRLDLDKQKWLIRKQCWYDLSSSSVTINNCSSQEQISSSGEVAHELKLCVATKRKLQFYFWKNRDFYELHVSFFVLSNCTIATKTDIMSVGILGISLTKIHKL